MSASDDSSLEAVSPLSAPNTSSVIRSVMTADGAKQALDG